MRRSVFVTLISLGVILTLAGGTGLFAALTDTASTGTNDVSSAGLAPSADLQLASATAPAGAVLCGEFSDNLTSALFTISDMESGDFATARFCIKNVGSQEVTVTHGITELTDVETGCTGDEALYDATCGATGAGELGAVIISAHFQHISCGDSSTHYGSDYVALDDLTTPRAMNPAVTLASGATLCFQTDVVYSTSATPEALQASQSDQVSWRYSFTGAA